MSKFFDSSSSEEDSDSDVERPFRFWKPVVLPPKGKEGPKDSRTLLEHTSLALQVDEITRREFDKINQFLQIYCGLSLQIQHPCKAATLHRYCPHWTRDIPLSKDLTDIILEFTVPVSWPKMEVKRHCLETWMDQQPCTHVLETGSWFRPEYEPFCEFMCKRSTSTAKRSLTHVLEDQFADNPLYFRWCYLKKLTFD